MCIDLIFVIDAFLSFSNQLMMDWIGIDCSVRPVGRSIIAFEVSASDFLQPGSMCVMFLQMRSNSESKITILFEFSTCLLLNWSP